jgi:hypothetical protein
MFGNVHTNTSGGVTGLSVGVDKERVRLSNTGECDEFQKPICCARTHVRERAALAKKEMAYWLTVAEEWKDLRNSPEPFDERIANRSNDLAESNNA